MFYGEESIRIRTSFPPAKIEEVIEEEVGRLGTVEFLGRGEFEVAAKKFKSFATDVNISGKLSKGRKESEWLLRVEYSTQPSGLCWVIAIVGFLFCLFGPLILLMPFLAKSEVRRAVERAVREVRDAMEAPDEQTD